MINRETFPNNQQQRSEQAENNQHRPARQIQAKKQNAPGDQQAEPASPARNLRQGSADRFLKRMAVVALHLEDDGAEGNEYKKHPAKLVELLDGLDLKPLRPFEAKHVC